MLYRTETKTVSVRLNPEIMLGVLDILQSPINPYNL